MRGKSTNVGKQVAKASNRISKSAKKKVASPSTATTASLPLAVKPKAKAKAKAKAKPILEPKAILKPKTRASVKPKPKAKSNVKAIAADTDMRVKNSKRKECDIGSIDAFIELLHNCKNIIIIAGAGISVSCGIPDFRSKDTGLYSNLDCSSIGIPSAELLFDFKFFQIDPQPFYKFAHMLLPSDDVKPSITHRFISLLQSKKKLLRNYTQNVDGLERKAGITNLVECHGNMNTFYCINCKYKCKTNDSIIQDIKDGNVIYCRKKKCCNADADDSNNILKPSITFFGENVPLLFDKCMKSDVSKNKCDMVIVMGTSLKVGGSVHELLKQLDSSIPRALFNKENVSTPSSMRKFDISLLGSCDDIVKYLCEQLQWDVDGISSTVRQRCYTCVQHDNENVYSISSIDR